MRRDAHLCPCCGGPMPDGPTPREELAGLVVSGPIKQAILRRLARRPGHWVSVHDLVEAAYGDDPDGGPLSAPVAVRGHLGHLRRLLPRFGWTIEREIHGYCGYRLVLV